MNTPAILISLLAMIASLPLNARQPNIVYILADDLGWRDLGSYGSTYYETPNIDELADSGVRFTSAYTGSPTCSPTRASILSGQDPLRTGIVLPHCHQPEVRLEAVIQTSAPSKFKALRPMEVTRFSNDFVTLPEVLREEGYITSLFGKWHLGRSPYLPQNNGFDVVVGGSRHPSPPPPGGYFSPWEADANLPELPPGAQIDHTTTTEACKFIAKNADKPFFLMLSFYGVHAPYHSPPTNFLARYQGKKDPQGLQGYTVMGAMISNIDEQVGRVVKQLKEVGLTDDTIVVFFSDNGAMNREIDGHRITNSFPLRGSKGEIYEGGVRVPLIFSWPKTLTPRTVHEPVVAMDMFPTLLEMAELPARPEVHLDGHSFAPRLHGATIEPYPVFNQQVYYHPFTHVHPAISVRAGDWKLLRFFADNEDQSDRFELYNLENDIGESNNLAKQLPERVKSMNQLLDQHLEATAAVYPAPNPDYIAEH